MIEGSYNIHGVILQFSNSVKYLGVTIDSKLSFKEQCDSMFSQKTPLNYMFNFIYSIIVQQNSGSPNKWSVKTKKTKTIIANQ